MDIEEKKDIQPESKEKTTEEQEKEKQTKIQNRNVYLEQKNCLDQFIWKQTENNSSFPFKMMTNSEKELQHKKLKDFKKIEEITSNFLKKEINKLESQDYFDQKQKQKFYLKSVVYWKAQHKYVQINKFDPVSLSYTCRVIKQKDQNLIDKDQNDEIVEIQQDQLTKYIHIQAQLLESSSFQKNQSIQFANIRVNINDKFDKIIQYFQKGLQAQIDGGSFLVNKKVIEFPADEVIEKNYVLDGQQISYFVQKIEFQEPTKWLRFKSFYLTDYFYLSSTAWDAVAFKPLRDVFFFGFGMLGSYNQKDVKIKVQWVIGDEQSEEYQIQNMDSEKDPEKKWFTIDIRQFGEKPVKVQEGTLIHCKIRCESDDYEQRRCFYGYDGGRNQYSTIEGQEFDFETAYSSHNSNSTSEGWGQIPFILYS